MTTYHHDSPHRLNEITGTTRTHLVRLINAVASNTGPEHEIDGELLIAIDRVNWLTASQLRQTVQAIADATKETVN